MTQVTIFNPIQFWRKYYAGQGSIFIVTDKEELGVLLGGSNMEDWILFGEISIGRIYCIKMNMV